MEPHPLDAKPPRRGRLLDNIDITHVPKYSFASQHIRQIAHEPRGEIPYGAERQPAVLKTFSQRLSRL